MLLSGHLFNFPLLTWLFLDSRLLFLICGKECFSNWSLMALRGWQGSCGFTTEHKSLCRREELKCVEVCPVVPEGSPDGEIRWACQPGSCHHHPPCVCSAGGNFTLRPRPQLTSVLMDTLLRAGCGGEQWGPGAWCRMCCVACDTVQGTVFLLYATFPGSLEPAEARRDREERGKGVEDVREAQSLRDFQETNEQKKDLLWYRYK